MFNLLGLATYGSVYLELKCTVNSDVLKSPIYKMERHNLNVFSPLEREHTFFQLLIRISMVQSH